MARIQPETRILTLDIVQEGDSPPNEIRLFAYGKTKTRKGEVLLDEQGAKDALADYAANLGDGNTLGLMFDYEHKSLEPLAPAGSGKASGWGRLAVRDDGLYVEAIQFTADAQQGIIAKEWRFFSPAVVLDKGARVVRVVNVALTNLPATLRQAPLLPLSEERHTMLTGEMADVAKRLGLDPAVATVADVLAALDVLLETAGKSGGEMSAAFSELAGVLRLDAASVNRDAKNRADAIRKAIERVKNGEKAERSTALSLIERAIETSAINPWQKPHYLRLSESDPAYVIAELGGVAGGKGGAAGGGGSGSGEQGGGNAGGKDGEIKQAPRGAIVLSAEDRDMMRGMGMNPDDAKDVAAFAEDMKRSGYTLAQT